MTDFVLYRILGNDLPPRHADGQTLANARFILQHEPPLENCQQRWVLNRIADQRAEAALIGLLEQHGRRYLRIPFVDAEYLACEIAFAGLPAKALLHRPEFRALPQFTRLRIREWCFRSRNLYLMNNNGARNAALADGRGAAEWVLPFDGNCFFSAAAWRELVAAAQGAAAATKYLIVPMARVLDNQQLLDPGWRPRASEEPQIAFRRGALEAFDERLRYGSMPKAALLCRLGVPGRWQEYGPRMPAWERVDLSRSAEAGQYAEAGWVARLYSGHDKAETSDGVREGVRLRSILGFCRAVDARIARAKFPAGRLAFFDEAALQAERGAWRRGVPDLVDCIAGLERAAGNALAFAAAPQDVKRLPALLDSVTILGLAWYFTGEERYARHAAALIRGWLVAPETRIEPLADGNPGIARLAGLAHALDGLRLAERSGALSAAEAAAAREWCRGLLGWFRRSATARDAAMRENAIGTSHDLVVAALALYLGETAFAREYLQAAKMRIATHVPAANTNEERADLQLWAHLARLAASAGIDLTKPLAALVEARPASRYRLPPRPGYGAAPFWMLG